MQYLTEANKAWKVDKCGLIMYGCWAMELIATAWFLLGNCRFCLMFGIDLGDWTLSSGVHKVRA